MTRYNLIIHHTFLRSKNYRKMTTSTENEVETISHTFKHDDGHMTSDNNTIMLKEAVYTPDCSNITPMGVKYKVNDLHGLAEFLTRGVEISLSIRKEVYMKGEGSKLDETRKQQKAQVLKSGKSSVLSRQPSRASSKVYTQGLAYYIGFCKLC